MPTATLDNVEITFLDGNGSIYKLDGAIIAGHDIDVLSCTNVQQLADLRERTITISCPKWWQFWKWRDLYRYKRFWRSINCLMFSGKPVVYAEPVNAKRDTDI